MNRTTLGGLLALTLSLGARAQSTIWVDVDAAGPGTGAIHAPYSSISQAITAAASGDLILVAPGLYFDTLNPNGKELWVRSIGGATQTVVQPAGTARVVLYNGGEGPGTVLEGFTLRDGSPSAASSAPGGGILVSNGSAVIIRS